MDSSTLEVFRAKFWLNPVLFLEASRIKSGVSKCVMPQRVFEPDFSVYETLNIQFTRFVNGDIDIEELFEVTEIIEEKALKSVDPAILTVISELDLEIIPTVAFTNRVLSREVFYPEIQFFVSRTPGDYAKRLKKLEKKILEGKIEFGQGREKLVRIEGELLGYPKCCIDGYVESKRTFPAESRLVVECIERGIFDSVVKAFKKSQIISVPQFFTSNFYPCSVECENASRIGLELEEWLEEFANAFRIRSMVNALYYLITGYKATRVKGSYGERLRVYYSRLGSEDRGVIKAVEPHIGNLTQFTNIFISRILKGFSNQSKTGENQKD